MSSTRRITNAEAKERIRQRIRVQIDEQNYEYIPERKDPNYYDNDVYQRVAVYVRVSTDDVRQTSSYELQKKYYEEFVIRHPKWELVAIYADEGISGTSLKKRDKFNEMIADCKAGKIDLIITKSVSRFARNVVDFLGMVRMLTEHQPPIGVFFEAENIFSLNETSTMALSFQATMAEEESRNKSRSMETSLRMRLDHGLPLTPKLLGFDHDENGHLIINPDTAHIPKLMFYMYLYGYSTSQIASALTALGKKTYRGNARWTSTSVAQTLRNERYCGDVYTRKTFTPDVLSHRSIKNRGERPRSKYLNEHDAIVSRDDFIAVQHMLKNAKYRNKSILPELRVITEGLLKGYVVINPRWGAFTAHDYLRASASAYEEGEDMMGPGIRQVELEAGDFDLRGYEIAHADLFGSIGVPYVIMHDRKIKFGTKCVRSFSNKLSVEILVHPYRRMFAVRPADPENRNSVQWGKTEYGTIYPREIPCAAFLDTLFSLFRWNKDYKYKMIGSLYRNGPEEAYIFRVEDSSTYIRKQFLPSIFVEQDDDDVNNQISMVGVHVHALPASMADSFGNDFYYEQSYVELDRMTREEWQIRVEGQLCNLGMKLQVTSYEELRSFIKQELADWTPEEEYDEY